jgi:hypothetical protein
MGNRIESDSLSFGSTRLMTKSNTNTVNFLGYFSIMTSVVVDRE